VFGSYGRGNAPSGSVKRGIFPECRSAWCVTSVHLAWREFAHLTSCFARFRKWTQVP
jgi:hypothetical protein